MSTDDHDPRRQRPNEFIADRPESVESRGTVDAEGPVGQRVEVDDVTLPLARPAAFASPVGAQGRCFGNYELLAEIARGGMGIVYKARQVSLNRMVALKMILSGQLASQEDVKRFYTEAEAAANLDHPGIVPIYEVGEHEGNHFFSMGYVEGCSLADQLDDGPLPPQEAAKYTKKIAEAIEYAHQRGVIHRDLKPGNVLLDRSGEPKVTDFGIAKKVHDDCGLTSTGQILGTPAYMPPEQAAGKTGTTKEAADIYALGAILYALLTSHPPFESGNPMDTLLLVLESEPVPPRKVNRSVPKDLETICLRCLEKEPERRYLTAADLANDLGRYLNGEPILARPLSTGRKVYRWARQKPGLATTWSAVGGFYAYHSICYWIVQLPDLTRQFHLAATALAVCWCLGAWVFQRLFLRSGGRAVYVYLWATLEVALLTTFLFVTDSAKSPLTLLYHCLVAVTVLRSRAGLVLYVTAAALAGYFCHVVFTIRFRPDLHLHFREVLPFALSLSVVGLIQYLTLRRLRGDEESPFATG